MSVYITINKRPSISICALKFSSRGSNDILHVWFFGTSLPRPWLVMETKLQKKIHYVDTIAKKEKKQQAHNKVISENFNDVTIFVSVFYCSSVHKHSSKALQLLC